MRLEADACARQPSALHAYTGYAHADTGAGPGGASQLLFELEIFLVAVVLALVAAHAASQSRHSQHARQAICKRQLHLFFVAKDPRVCPRVAPGVISASTVPWHTRYPRSTRRRRRCCYLSSSPGP